MIEFQNITKEFKTETQRNIALDQVSLKVSQGEIYGIIGHSGAGKSTLIRVANLLEKPTSGQVVFNGMSLTSLSAKDLRKTRQDMGMIFQGFHLLETATVYENIAIPLKLTGLDFREMNKRVKEYLSVVGLEEKEKAYPAQLSGGQKQRVAIARALSLRPKVLLCDEATSALDPETTESILALLTQINRDFGITMLLITHEMQVIQRICDSVAVMEAGKVVEKGDLTQIISAPKHPITKKFINSQFPSGAEELVNQPWMDSHLVVELSFVGKVADKPVLAEVAKKFHVYPNILSGNMVPLKKQHYGKLLVQLQGDKEETEKSLDYLKAKGIGIDVVRGGGDYEVVS